MQAHSWAKWLTMSLALLAVLGVSPIPAAAQARDEQRAVLITGATSGIGLRMAEVISQNGFYVYAGARKPEDIARLNAMDNVSAVRLDVTVDSDIAAAVAFVEAEGRGLYGLINNAGVAVMGPLIEIPESEVDFLFDVNLKGPYRVTKAFADLIIESEGRILNVSSIGGVISAPFSGVYSMSKHGSRPIPTAWPPRWRGSTCAWRRWSRATISPGSSRRWSVG